MEFGVTGVKKNKLKKNNFMHSGNSFDIDIVPDQLIVNYDREDKGNNTSSD
jgi:hypothetical protein